MNILNFDRICRVCKSETDNLQLIFKDFQTPETPSNFAEMLMACASVQVLSGDGLPKSLCIQCIEKLQNAYKFRKQCEATDVSLRNYLKENGIKQELMYNPDITENVIDFTTILSVKNSIKSEITQNLQNEDIIIACNNMHMKEIQSSNNLPLNKTNSSKCKSNYKCHVCNKEYSCSSHLQRHLRLHYPRKIYICKICNKSLSRLEHLKRHMVIHLKNKPHVCKTCKRGFNKEDNLYTHEQRCKGQRPYICKICNRGFNREDSLEVHVASHDSNVDIKPMLDSLENIENYIRVENYADTLIEKNYLEPHVSIFEQDSDFEKDDGFENKVPIVPTCEPKEDSTVKETDIKTEIELEEKYDLSDSLRLPSDTDSKDENEVNSDVPQKRKRGRPRKGEIRTPPIKKKKTKKRQNQVQIVPLKKEKANFKNFSCNQCERLFLTPLDLEIHQLKHAGVQKFSCKVCLKEFIRGDHLKRHMICHLEHKPYSCDICTKSFARKDHMIRHVKLHSFEKKYECDVCKRMFSREELLNKHKAVKHGIGEKIIPEKKFKCETCGKFFTTEKYRDTHMKAHKEKDKMVHCKTCDRHFETRAELVNHLKLTNDCSRRFLCSECGQRFTKKDYLQVHMRRHRGEKPFKCKYCEKGFPRTTDLKAHEKCHTGEKNHLCIVCGKGFGRAYKLTLHMRTHTGEKPYQCTYCDAAFAQSNDLKAHIRRHTGERYHCDLCTDAFLMGYMLTQHKRNVHGIEVASSQRPIARLQPSVYNISVVKPETLRAPTTTTTLDPRPIPAFSFSQTLNLLNHPNYT